MQEDSMQGERKHIIDGDEPCWCFPTTIQVPGKNDLPEELEQKIEDVILEYNDGI